MAQLEGVAKTHGFASFDEYNTVIGNISLVMDGIDPQTKKYIGPDAALKLQVEQVKANKQMSAAAKKRELAYLAMALGAAPRRAKSRRHRPRSADPSRD
jgi:hypothetical protein